MGSGFGVILSIDTPFLRHFLLTIVHKGANLTGAEFLRRARRYAKRHGKAYHYDPRQGKGSHGILYVGDHRTTVKRGELATGTFRNMLKQLDIPKEDF